MSLRLDWCSHEAAKYACEKWHYSGCMPAGKIVKVGVWENQIYIGCVLFSRGASPDLCKRYGLSQFESCELTRIALTKHINPVSKILSIAIKLLKGLSSGLKLIVSFADQRQNHHGGIYQACNWVYSGLSERGGSLEYFVGNRWIHHRSFGSKFGCAGKKKADSLGIKTRPYQRKYVYLFPLDLEIKKSVAKLAKPYPKRAGSKDNVVSANHAEEGGATPTSALQSHSSTSSTATKGISNG